MKVETLIIVAALAAVAYYFYTRNAGAGSNTPVGGADGSW